MEGLIQSLVQKKITVTEILKIIVSEIRPSILGSDKAVINRFTSFVDIVEQNPEIALYLGKGIGDLMEKKDLISLFTESGIYKHQSFFKSIIRKIYHIILPPITDHQEIKFDFNEIFHRKNDYQWLKIIPNDLWNCFYSVGIIKWFLTQFFLKVLHIIFHTESKNLIFGEN